MKKKPKSPSSPALSTSSKTEFQDFRHRPTMAELYRRAETQLRKQRKTLRSRVIATKSEPGDGRLFHELQVHQVELEMQNEELQKGRDAMEMMLEKYTDLYDFAPVGYFTLTAEGTIQLVNLTGAQLVGIARSRLLGVPFGLLTSEELRPSFDSFLKRVFAGHAKPSIDLELLNKGRPRQVVRIRAERLPDGKTCRAAVMDITELKREEDKVRVSEIRYRRLFEAAHDGVLLLDPGTRKITDANPFMTRLLGYPRDQLVGKELFEIGLLKDEVASQEMFRKLKLKHEVRYEDLPLESQGGKHQEVEVVANLYQENGHAVIQCNIRDITERKRVEQALSTSEERYRTLFELGPVGVYSCDASGWIQNSNNRAAELWGRKPAMGKSGDRFCASFKLFHPDGRLVPRAKCPMAEVLRGRISEVRDQEVILERPDASRLTCVMNIRPLKNKGGKVIGAINCFYDITARKQAEETQRRLEVLGASNLKLRQEIIQRLAAEESLKQSEQRLNQSLTHSGLMQEQLRDLSRQLLQVQEEERKRISRELHDVIAQTLTGINTRLATLKKESGLNAADFDRSITRTQQLVQESVDIVHRFARELRPAVLDDLGLIPALHSFLKHFTEECGVRTHLIAFAGVEQLDTDRRTVLFRIAQEALMNVARHAHASQAWVEIRKLDRVIQMEIKDDGKGFEPDPSSSGKKNKRLGLLGMKERMEMVNGNFKIVSAPGQGTTVQVQFPLLKSAR